MKSALSLITLAILSSPSFAEKNTKNDMEVIEVTSNFRQANLMKTQGSISVIGNNDIVDRNAMHAENLLGTLANVNFSSGASRGNFVQIRGIGLRSQFVDPINPSVGLVIDGINYSGLGGAASLFDVDAFTLYRGPQGTQFGNDAMAGIITIDSTGATATQVNRALFSVGDYGTYSAGVAGGGRVLDNLNVRLSAQTQQSDGYVTNDFLKRDDTNNIDESNVKLKTNWQVTNDLVVDTTFHYIDVDNGYDAFSLDENGRTLSDEPGSDTQRTKAIGVNAKYSGFDGVKVQVIASSLDSDLTYSYDEDWSYVGIHAWEYSYTDKYDRTRQQSNADIRLLSDGFTLFDNTVSWVGGVYMSQRDSGLTRQYTDESKNIVSDNEHSDAAVYGQMTYQLSPKTTMTLGARVGQYDIEYNDSKLVSKSLDDTLFGFHFNVTNQVNEQALTYLSFSRSDKAGGVNGDALAKVDDITDPTLKTQLLNNATFDPETLYSAEFGVKGRSLDDKLNIKLAAFYNYRNDPQLKGWVTDKIGENKAETFVGFNDNAGSGRGYGLEIETRYSYTDNVDFYYNVGYLITRIKDYVVEKKSGQDLNMNNRNMAHAPEYQFNAGLDYHHDNGFYAGVEVQGKDSFYYSDSHNQQSKFYALTNISMGYQGNDWRVNLAANNIFDEEYAVRGFYFANDPRDFYEVEHNYVQLGAPQTVNLSVEVNW
jgi:iron complex outermembrane receptor protein